MAEVRRTVVVKLDVDDHDATLLHETVEEYLWACNYVVRDAWKDDYKPTSKTKLHDRTYSDVRDQTRLQANLVQSARNRPPKPSRASSPGGRTARRRRNHTSRRPLTGTTNGVRHSTTTMYHSQR